MGTRNPFFSLPLCVHEPAIQTTDLFSRRFVHMGTVMSLANPYPLAHITMFLKQKATGNRPPLSENNLRIRSHQSVPLLLLGNKFQASTRYILHIFGKVKAFVQCPNDRHSCGHDDKFADSGGCPSDPKRKAESQFQLQGDNEHCERKDKRVHHHPAPNAFNKACASYRN